MSDTIQAATESIYQILENVISEGQRAVKPPTLDELKTRSELLAKYLRLFEDEYYTTEDPRFARTYENLYELYTDVRDFYIGARNLLR